MFINNNRDFFTKIEFKYNLNIIYLKITRLNFNVFIYFRTL